MPIRPGIICFALIILTASLAEAPASHVPEQITPPAVTAPEPAHIRMTHGMLKKGETASSLLNAYLPLKTVYRIMDRARDIFPLHRIRTGQPYMFSLDGDRFMGFEYEINKTEKLVIQRQEHAFSIFRSQLDFEKKHEVVTAILRSSLFEAVTRAGEQGELAFRLADIFAWDIDFIRDIRPGDHFRVLVEKKYRNGRFLEYGNIKAAMFFNRGTMYKAFMHQDDKGQIKYYDQRGNSLEKAFLKAPLAFSRISSGFSLKRMHPILKEFRAHPGVDYAAPEGTPIKTVGDGTVVGMGYSKTMGNHVIIRHGRGYVTRYYHMSRFARGLTNHKRVTQGEIIGYVGMTGYATGPHLCFRIQKNGKPVNPLTHHSPLSAPVSPGRMEAFQAKKQQWFERMALARRVRPLST